jgi:hypothetical protein
MLSRSLGQVGGSLCRRCGDQNRILRKLHRRFAAGLQQLEAIPVEAQSGEMCLQSTSREVTWIHYQPLRN